MKTYNLCDNPTDDEVKNLGVDLRNVRWPKLFLCAVFSGEKRAPKAGEWYLSGARPGAYRAPNDLSTVFHIAKLVLVEKNVSEKIIQS